MANKVNQVNHSKNLNRIKLIYVDHGSVINRLTIWGTSGRSCHFEYYERLGLPYNYKIDHVSGTLAMNFDHKSRVKIYISRKDQGSVKSAKASGPHHSPKDSSHGRQYFQTRVIEKHPQVTGQSLKDQVALNQDPYDDINMILLALGYTIKRIGQAIKSLHNEAKMNR